MKPVMMIVIVAFMLIFVSSVQAAQFSENLNKSGQGTVYYLGFIKVYDAALFISEMENKSDVLSSEVSKCLHLEYDVDISKDIFVESAETVLGRQFTKEQLSQVQEDINKIHQGYQDVEEGDTYTLCYDDKSQQTTLALNNDVIVTADSPEFAKVYFSIWLGEKEPLDDDLRDDLLAR